MICPVIVDRNANAQVAVPPTRVELQSVLVLLRNVTVPVAAGGVTVDINATT